MVFSNIDVDPRDTLGLAQTKSTLWNEAHAELTQRCPNLERRIWQFYLKFRADGAL